MRVPRPLFSIAAAIFIAVCGLGAFAWYTVSKYRLPFAALPIITTLLGPSDFFATYSASRSLSTSRKTSKRPLPPFHLAINLALLLLPTVMIALGAPYLAGESKCQLRDTWQAWYSAHDKNAIQGVQDIFQCCGFGKVTEMPFPFYKGPRKGEKKPEVPAGTCAQALGRSLPCAPFLEGELKLAMGMVVAAAALTLLLKFAFLMIVVGRPKFAERWFAKQDYNEYNHPRAIENLNDDYEEPEEEEAAPPHITTNVSAIENGVDERTGLLPETRLLPRDHGRSSHHGAINGGGVWGSP
ncbi:uncharacterized protein DFL_006688 [Arthrobotrys flagrans]|uniref:Tetraspanin Tsp3 n=1 Tax=Arthrobotrys flagrans TaxID=97331 RepID=A0A436ZU33_ARTFL|nr:hypothetical protein DFL_006688 [Arthrobotrys flagrans]